MAMLKAFTSLAITAMLIKLAVAANYTVGGQSGGWDTSTNLQSWASSQRFLVGDNLNFQYSFNHDVLEVNKGDYDSCQATNPIQTYTGGSTSIPLSSPGKKYFICGTSGHCSQGMKMEISTLATATPPGASPRTKTPPPASSPSPSTPPTASKVPPPVTSPPVTATSPSSSPAGSPASTPSSPDAPSTDTPTSALSPGGTSPQPSPSSANRAIFMAGLSYGVGVLMASAASALLLV